MPASGGLSNIFGRQPLMLASIGFFTVGSAIAGAAQNMNMLIAARGASSLPSPSLPSYCFCGLLIALLLLLLLAAVQGFGGGGILSLSEIIVADLVPLRERGKYGGLLGAVWALASVLGPPVGGALASAGQWRVLFCESRVFYCWVLKFWS